ncbi:uncharacterized protein ACWYII_033867 [Salvelinus alpinus]
MSGLKMENTDWYWCRVGELEMPVHIIQPKIQPLNNPLPLQLLSLFRLTTQVKELRGTWRKSTRGYYHSFSCIIPHISARNLGVILDNTLSFSTNIKAVTRSCRFMLYNIRRVRPCLTQEAAQVLIQALVISRLDYCNSLLAGLPACAIKPLQLIQNAAARLVFNLPKFSHATPLLRSLHWLPVEARIRYKTMVLAYGAVRGTAPPYLQALIRPYTQTRALRSSTSGLLASLPLRKYSSRSAQSKLFAALAPQWWNKLPHDARSIDVKVLLISLGMLVVVTAGILVTWKMWRKHKDNKAKDQTTNNSVSADFEQDITYSTVTHTRETAQQRPNPESHHDVMYRTVMPDQFRTAEKRNPFPEADDDVTYSTVIPQHKAQLKGQTKSAEPDDNLVYSSLALQVTTQQRAAAQ